MSDAREKLFKGLRTEEVKFEDRGISVTVRELTGDERDDLLEAFYSQDEEGRLEPNAGASRKIFAHLVALCAMNGDGQPLFGLDDIGEVGKLSAKVRDELGGRILALSGLGTKLEEQAGNS